LEILLKAVARMLSPSRRNAGEDFKLCRAQNHAMPQNLAIATAMRHSPALGVMQSVFSVALPQ
jgi:hypothetical protein